MAVTKALGDKRGIARYGEATLPMDEALAQCAIDLSGRPFFVGKVPLPKATLGSFEVELLPVFFEGFARGASANLHLRLLEGENLHHILEICFKAFAKALMRATRLDPRVSSVPSTKGSL
jgi:imidazoleglycerol-phosphate dehydratase